MEDRNWRIHPLALPILGEEPFRSDLLGRIHSAEVLTRIVSRIKGPCVMAIDAPWGYGKTTFLTMWAKWLRQEEQGFPIVAFFNAWETDFTNRPFLALSSELTKELESSIKKTPISGFRKFRKTASKLLRVAIPAMPTLAGSLVPAGAPAFEAFFSMLSAAASRETDTNDYQEAKEAIARFKVALGELAQGLDKPLVIMIDELDRCRPSYAIELLEVAKHLFAVDNVVFVLAVNRSELFHSVKALYGSDFDAEGYLRRFFDLDFQLPRPDREPFVEEALKTTKLTSILMARGRSEDPDSIKALLRAFLGSPELSLRRVQQAVHRLGLVLDLLPADTVGLTLSAVVVTVLRTVDFTVYQRFVAGEAADMEVADVVFSLRETASLRSVNHSYGLQIESRIILGLLSAKAEYFDQDYLNLETPFLDQYRKLKEEGTPDSADVRYASLVLDRVQTVWDSPGRMHWVRQNRTFLDSIKRLELISPELGEGRSA